MIDLNTETLLAALLGYILGAIPFGLVLCFATGHGDIRKIGSGNIGATNVLRTGNKLLAFATLIGDVGKGGAAVFAASLLFDDPYAMMLAGFAAIIGHIFPVWLKFKGGKGVATTLGTYLVLAPYVGLATCGTWLVMAVLFRYSSLSALIAILLSPLYAFFFYNNIPLTILLGLITIIVWVKHHTNIRRLLKGEEPKIGSKKKAARTENNAGNNAEKKES
tara:strand:+ start:3538 stop:4197 length:660 start_codon:yes stop_codon:yes gene_type:complete